MKADLPWKKGLAILASGLVALVFVRLLMWLFDLQDTALAMTICAMLAAQLGFSAAERSITDTEHQD